MTAALLALLLAATPVAARPIAITHVAVVDVEAGTIVRDRSVVIERGRITVIGDAFAVPRGARRVDGRGGYLVPGLVDMHVHLFNNASKRAPNDWAFPLFVASGVTGVREMAALPSDVAQVRTWNDAVDAGKLVAPRVLATGVPVRCGEGRDVVAQVDAIANVGAFAKAFSDVDDACFAQLMDASRERNVTVVGHVPAGVALLDAAKAGLRTDEHLMQAFEACTPREREWLAARAGLAGQAQAAKRDEQEADVLAAFDADECKAVARALVATRQVQVPTLVLPRVDVARHSAPDADPRWPLVRADEQARWHRYLAPEYVPAPALAMARDRVALAIARTFHEAGVPLLAGTDAPMPNLWPGSSLHDELGLLVEAGLTPAEALRAATLAPARFLGVDAEIGTVAVGKRADLVLLDENPLVDIAATRRIRAVALRGRWLDRAALDALLRPVPSRE